MWRLDDEERLIALFPKMNYETGDCHARGCCLSYMHNGQHSEADYHFIMRHSRPATKAEYAELKKELEIIYGYKLKEKEV
jgi:hypothetical protein